MLLKIAQYEVAQRNGASFVNFKVHNADGSISAWSGWKNINPEQLGSLILILNSGNAFYDGTSDMFSMSAAAAFVDNVIPSSLP
jgi:hypothetical protein